MAGSCTQLMWGAITFKDGYTKASQLNNVVDSLLWVTDYLVKAHTSKYELVGQVHIRLPKYPSRNASILMYLCL